MLCECAASVPSEVRLADRIEAGEDVMLIEPLPSAFKQLASKWDVYPNVSLHNVAIALDEGHAVMLEPQPGTSGTFMKGVYSPAFHKRQKRLRTTSYRVDAVRFSSIDPGDITELYLDMEGSEWFVLQHLLSQPGIITIEMRSTHSTYKNPFATEIVEWMAINSYELQAEKDGDNVYHHRYLPSSNESHITDSIRFGQGPD